MKRLVFFIFVLMGISLAACSAHAAFTVPPAGQAVTDAAGILSPGTERELENLLRAVWQDGGSQLAVVTVPDLDGLPVEQAALEIAEAWQLGTKKDDQGILFLVAPRERRMRIEVGQGREGDLPDAIAKRIITTVVTPYFQSGDFDGGVRAGTLAILERTDPERLAKFGGGARATAPPQQEEHRPLSLGELIVMGILLLFLLGTPMGRSLLFFWLMSGGGRGGGGGWGGGGGGGGRYGGGGGGFSGGGASGSW